jgi:hypothetical protein
VAALDGAVALEEMDDVAVPVAQHLHFDVAGVLDALLQEHLRAAEGLGRLGHDALVSARELPGVCATTDTAATAAGGRLEHDRKAELFRQAYRLVGALEVAFTARDHRDTGRLHGAPRCGLVAHVPDDAGRRADEDHPAPRTDLGQLGVLGEEAVAGVQGMTSGGDRQVHEPVGVEIPPPDGVRADVVGLVRLFDVQGMTVGVRIDRHGLDPHLGAGPHDTHGDLAAVGD